MLIYTIGFTKSTAKNFFDRIIRAKPEIVIDVRLNNTSQLAGFAKGEDLLYFINEICGCKYKHDIMFAPSSELLDVYKHNKITWAQYVTEFNRQMDKKNIINYFIENYGKFKSVCFVCSENTPDLCHRRLLSEKIIKQISGEIVHL